MTTTLELNGGAFFGGAGITRPTLDTGSRRDGARNRRACGRHRWRVSHQGPARSNATAKVNHLSTHLYGSMSMNRIFATAGVHGGLFWIARAAPECTPITVGASPPVGV